MAYQLLALAIKKKYKHKIRPVDEDEWLNFAGEEFDH